MAQPRQIHPTPVSVLSWADTQRNERGSFFSTSSGTLAKIRAEAPSPDCSAYCPELVRKFVTSDSRVKIQVLSKSGAGIIFAPQL